MISLSNIERLTTEDGFGELSFYRPIGDSAVTILEAEIAALDTHLKKGDIAIDVGANIGAMAIRMARIVGPSGTVFAIEPQADIYELLYANILANKAYNVIRAFEAG